MTRTLSVRLVEQLTTSRAMTLEQLEATGMSRSTLRRYIGDGLLVEHARGVVGLAADDDPWTARCTAALLRNESGALSHQSAAQLLSIPVRDDRIHLTLPHAARQRDELFVIHRSTLLPRDHLREIQGLRCTSLLRTLFDLATTATSDDHYHWILEQTVVAQRTTLAAVAASFDEMGARGRPGSRRRGLVLGRLIDEDPVATDSELEAHFLATIRRAGLTGIEIHFEPDWFDGTRGVVDAAIPSCRLIIELDGRRWHTTRAQFANDRERDRRAVEAGWRVLRFTHGDVIRRPQAVVDSILRATGVPNG